MIVFISYRMHGRAVRSMVEGTLGAPTPKIRHTHYERLFRAWRVPRATYVFCDFDCLLPWMLERAARLYRTLQAAGLKCLNDPAKAMARVELLTTLQRRGINPFGVYRADADPRPSRFPVFIRAEYGHDTPSAALYDDQEALEAGLRDLQGRGIPLRGLLVIELASERYNEDLWAKWGTWRIGARTVLEHIAVDDTWLVKTGDHAKVSAAIAQDEHDAVVSNRYAEDMSAIFDMAHIEYGRADHGRFGGKSITFEINTNPYIGPYVEASNPVRAQTALIARQKLAEALWDIDTAEGGSLWLPEWRKRRPWGWMRPRLGGPPGP